MIYIAKYYPLIDGKETEYVTTVEAEDKSSAEAAVRKAFIERFEQMAFLIKNFDVTFVGQDPANIPVNIEYAKKMRIVITESIVGPPA